MKKKITFVDFFAGAGGFSEGFLQASTDTTEFDFLLASDINENCELTHLVRYNYQLGLKTKFLRKSISDDDFIDQLLENLEGQSVDVICGGPPCQSFSLAGRRRKHDRKDDLFASYLRVIARLQPKYFVMENVTGLLTKEKGAFKRRIIDGIASIIDVHRLPELQQFTTKLSKLASSESKTIALLTNRIVAESQYQRGLSHDESSSVEIVSRMFRDVVGTSLSYKDSKTNREVLTVRHAVNILRNRTELEKLAKATKHFKHVADIDQDDFVDTIDNFIDHLSIENVVETAVMACSSLSVHNEDFATLSSAIETFGLSVNECLSRLSLLADDHGLTDDFSSLTKSLQLYACAGPKVLLASNYGVPQDRRRVVFIGCRNDVPLIDDVPSSVRDSEKVTVSEAISDLDTLEAGERNNRYLSSAANTHGRTSASMRDDQGLSYSDWSRRGRVPIKHVQPPTFFKSIDDYHAGIGVVEDLHNHEASNHNPTVIKRYSAMIECGDYDSLKGQLDSDIASEKRDYSVLKPDGQSPTVMTIADDFVHYRVPRAITVREMARLQSFDDSFVFQGKRTTGGHRRKEEIPQCTLVGNAVPPLLAKAIADVIGAQIDSTTD